jgi:hypothetical protein
MSKARLVITAAVVEEGRSQGEVARAYGVSQGWVSRLMARYHAEGEAAFEPQSRRPKTTPRAIPAQTAGSAPDSRTGNPAGENTAWTLPPWACTLPECHRSMTWPLTLMIFSRRRPQGMILPSRITRGRPSSLARCNA